jgi:glycosyltransferase involved in cell wall biosynthesis
VWVSKASYSKLSPRQSDEDVATYVKLVVIIPAYNEADHIADVIRAVPREIANFDEILTVVIDDGSKDQTAENAMKAGASRVVTHVANEGVGRAFQTGIAEALKLGADVVVNIDGDGQFDPAEIVCLVEPIVLNQADCAVGSRFLSESNIRHMPIAKRFGNAMFTRTVNWLIGSKLTDTQSGFRAYSRDAILRLTLFGSYTYTQEVLIDLIRKNQRIIDVPVKVAYDPSRKSRVVKSMWRYGIRTSAILLRTVRDIRPLAFFGSAGLALLVGGVASGLFVFSNWILTGQTSPYRSLIDASIVLITTGSLTGFLALLADMMGRHRTIEEEILYLLRKRAYSKSVV